MKTNSLLSTPVQPDWQALVSNLRREGTPQRVHHIELHHDPEVMEAIIARFDLDHGLDRDDPRFALRRLIAFHRFMGFDYFTVAADNYIGFPRGKLDTVDTTPDPSVRRSARAWTDEQTGPIGSWEDFEKYPWPDVSKCGTDTVEWLAKNVPEDMCLRAGCHQIFEQVTWLTGYQRLCYLLYDEPELVDALFNRIGETFLKLAEIYVQIPRIAFLMAGDDMGHKTGTMVGPPVLQKAFHWHKRITDLAHAHGKLNLLHCCGNRTEIMDDLIDYCGLDGVHSFEDVIEPVELAKERWGNRIALLGGIDVHLLATADEDTIRRRVRQVLDTCMPGGGYCLGTGNSVANYIPLENYLTMVDEGRRWALR